MSVDVLSTVLQVVVLEVTRFLGAPCYKEEERSVASFRAPKIRNVLEGTSRDPAGHVGAKPIRAEFFGALGVEALGASVSGFWGLGLWARV